jgi:hypothetical protein
MRSFTLPAILNGLAILSLMVFGLFIVMSAHADTGMAGPPSLFSDEAPSYYTSPSTPNYVAPPAPKPVMPGVQAAAQPPIYQDTSGSTCRQYSQHLRTAGGIQESYGTACLQPDGSWRVVK